MKYYFYLSMSAKEFMPYYQGKASSIVVLSESGKRIQFPAMHLRSFLVSNGIHGRFCLETQNNKFLSIKKINM
ncbi:DUF2835 domain-containing protein [Litorilituus lipolyticus]|uniref:DUF2835 family protein n=1 Tax=Litorilituus lipolyticus TaxID=2491017 RepID=A0A502KMM2_9GAMM|nr:DUF2835 domain-containing protein [Litorilituus lipolyticus]TPH12852.1 DUF2835 family protein [Litorilituus lipolyticus]